MTYRLASAPIATTLPALGLALAVAGCGAATPAAQAPIVVTVPTADAAPVKAKEGKPAAPDESTDPAAARKKALEEAEKYGIIGLIGGDVELDDVSDGGAVGGVVGGAPGGVVGGVVGGVLGGSSFGAGGLGLSGVGMGGGGSGVGLGSIGTIGRGAGGGGTGYGIVGGYGGDPVTGQSMHVSGDMVIELGDTVTLGVAVEAATRMMRGRVYALRGCYAKALDRNRRSAGTVALRLVVGKDGHVALARELGSDLGDPEAIACVLEAMKGVYVAYVGTTFFGVVETSVRFSPKK